MSSEPQRNKVQVLLVEDNPGDVHLLRLALRNAQVNCDLQVIGDGAQALQFVRDCESQSTHSSLPDIAILDLNVPKNDGVEILEAIRASTRFAQLPVLILTSSSSPREAARLQCLGVSGHLIKPPDFEAFMGIGPVIRRMLEEHQLL
jgi:two-component system response regulator